MTNQNRAFSIRKLTARSLRLFGVISLGCASSALALTEAQPTVKVGVYAQHVGGKIVYHYRIINKTAQTITAVVIGRDTQNIEQPGVSVYELYELPSGWNERFGIPAANSNSPTGWRASMVTPEAGGPTHAISWEPLNDKSPKILPGETNSKMSVALDKVDGNYMAGHALVSFDNGPKLNVLLDRLDSTPPSFTVDLSPNTILPQDDKFVAVNATFTVKDDYDRMPEIKLESVTADELWEPDDIRDASLGLDDRYLKFRAASKNPLGRIYTVTYSATDASGNQAIASATVTITTTIPSVDPASVTTPDQAGKPAEAATVAPPISPPPH